MNRDSRKPFYWGGLKGYEQLQAIAQVLQSMPPGEPETSYLRRLAMQVNRAVEKNRILAQDLREAHTWLRRIAECLRYPPSSSSASDSSEAPLTSEQVKREMDVITRQSGGSSARMGLYVVVVILRHTPKLTRFGQVHVDTKNLTQDISCVKI